MTIWYAILLGILQGATEFLPVSSSGHLVLVPHIFGWPDPGLALDTVLHLGTILAVVIYFWKDLWRIVRAVLGSLQKRSLAGPDARLGWYLALATLPGALGGLLLEDYFESLFGAPKAVAGFLLVTAALLLVSEYARQKKEHTLTEMAWSHALLIGVAQMLAIAPGLSRSGATMAAGMLLGYRREESARFSFLLSVPIILGSGGYQLLKLATGEAGGTPLLFSLVGLVPAALTGFVAISGLLYLVRRQSLWPFAAYCALLGILVLTGLLG